MWHLPISLVAASRQKNFIDAVLPEQFHRNAAASFDVTHIRHTPVALLYVPGFTLKRKLTSTKPRALSAPSRPTPDASLRLSSWKSQTTSCYQPVARLEWIRERNHVVRREQSSSNFSGMPAKATRNKRRHVSIAPESFRMMRA